VVAGVVVLLLATAVYSGLYWDRVIDLPPRVIIGTEYTEVAKDFRVGFANMNGHSPTNSQMLSEFVRSPDARGMGLTQIVEQLWTRDSLRDSYYSLLGSWLLISILFTFVIIRGLASYLVQRSGAISGTT
jgi:hypothetical protein